MNSPKFAFKFKVKRTFYIEEDEEEKKEINYSIPLLQFHADGKVTAQGEDQQGRFCINGYVNDDDVDFIKFYYENGKTIYNVGRIEENRIDLVHSYTHSDEEIKTMRNQLNEKKFTGGIVIDLIKLELIINNVEYIIYMRLTNELGADWQGFCFIDKKLYKACLTFHGEDDLHFDGILVLRTTKTEEEKEYKVKVTDCTITALP